jgi:hypothetical protein
MLTNFMPIWSISLAFGIIYAHLVYFAAILYIFPVLVCCTKKNLATLAQTRFKKCIKRPNLELASHTGGSAIKALRAKKSFVFLSTANMRNIIHLPQL